MVERKVKGMIYSGELISELTLLKKYGLPENKVAKLAGISQRTINRWKKNKTHPSESSLRNFQQVIELITKLEEVFENENEAKHWLSTPNDSLNGKSPKEVLVEDNGLQKILTLLTRLEWGIPD
jgi:putative toxin-antitoxin system antitoxin component (TIGR02293 family)